jgi:uncharacterized membrane protein YdjX (TVP38/TMEM64 family)
MIKKTPIFASKKEKKKAIVAIVFICLLIIIALIVGYWTIKFLSNVQQSKEFILGFGLYAPIIFIGLQVLQIIFAVIPASPLILIGGYVFGSLLGSIYSIIGITLGSLFAFCLAKKLGRPFVEKVIHKKYIAKIDNVEENKLAITLFVLLLLPMLPNDAFCYAAGLTKMHYKKFFYVVILGRAPIVIILSFLGYQISKLSGVFAFLAIVLLILISIILLVKREILGTKIKKGITEVKRLKNKHFK